jgi:hypothetical protein
MAGMDLIYLIISALVLGMMWLFGHSCWLGGKLNAGAWSELPMKRLLTGGRERDRRKGIFLGRRRSRRPLSVPAFGSLDNDLGWHQVGMGILFAVLAVFFGWFGVWIYINSNACPR